MSPSKLSKIQNWTMNENKSYNCIAYNREDSFRTNENEEATLSRFPEMISTEIAQFSSVETIKWSSFLSSQKPFVTKFCRQRPYHVESTSSRPITEVKQRWARLVLGWVTAWEHRVLLAFFFFLPFIF